MFKALLLQSWHSLSDPELEEALRVRIDFMLFTGMGIENEVPDETTICRFRNKLVSQELDQELLEEINGQLELQGLKVGKATGAVIDASVIESAARPNRCIEVAEDRNEEIHNPGDQNISKPSQEEVVICESADPDARWSKKGKRCYFGYKLFLVTDDKDGYATSVDVTPANKSETKHFAEFIAEVPCQPGTRIYADKAYALRENRKNLQSKKLKDGIMEKAYMGKPLTKRQKQKNRLISKRRHIVERGYVTMKRLLKFGQASYIGLVLLKLNLKHCVR